MIASVRDRWVIGTKYTVTTRPDDPNAGGNHRKSLVQPLERSLRRLGTDYLDVLWVHAPERFTPIEEVLRALDDQVRSGKVLYVGISDFPAWRVAHARALSDERGLARFAGLQVPYSLIERTVERELLPMAQALELTVTSWAPVGGGLLTGRYGTERARPIDTRLAGIGGRHEQSTTRERNLKLADVANAIPTASTPCLTTSPDTMALTTPHSKTAHAWYRPILAPTMGHAERTCGPYQAPGTGSAFHSCWTAA